jgi:RimJ/RimL family protein N-acetyltransferase
MTGEGDALFDFQPVLVGERMTMRPMQAGDYAELLAIGADPAVWALHPQPERATEAGFRAYFDDHMASGGALVAMLRDGGVLAGCSRFSMQYTEPGEVEIGWTFLGRSYWGGSANAEMKWLMMSHAFGFVERVIFRVGEHNLRSRRAMEKIGGVLLDKVQRVTIGGRPSTNVYYVICQEDFAGSSWHKRFTQAEAEGSPNPGRVAGGTA